MEYLLQEVYGLENKSKEDGDDSDSDIEEDLGAECVICITDTRDTILLPCRHLCLCNSCGKYNSYILVNPELPLPPNSCQLALPVKQLPHLQST